MESNLIDIGRKLAELGLDGPKIMDVLQLVVDAAEAIAEEQAADQRQLDALRADVEASAARKRRKRGPARGTDRKPRARRKTPPPASAA